MSTAEEQQAWLQRANKTLVDRAARRTEKKQAREQFQAELAAASPTIKRALELKGNASPVKEMFKQTLALAGARDYPAALRQLQATLAEAEQVANSAL